MLDLFPDDHVSSVDVCAICADSECCGVDCYGRLDPDADADRAKIEQVQTWVRAGKALLITNRNLVKGP